MNPAPPVTRSFMQSPCQFPLARQDSTLPASAATRAPIDRQEVSPGESMPAAWISAGWFWSGRIMKSANDSPGGCSLARMPVPPSARSCRVTVGQEQADRLQELLDRQAVAFVVVLPRLEARRGTEQHVSAERLRQVHAEAVARRQRHGIDQAADPAGPRLAQRRVLPPARIDREPLPAERRRQLVGVEAGRVDDRRAS